MAIKIKDTPTLYGKDAEEFQKIVEENLKKDHTDKVVYSDYGEELIDDRKTCEGCLQYCMDFLDSKCLYKKSKIKVVK